MDNQRGENHKIEGLEALRGLAAAFVVLAHIPVYLALPPLLNDLIAFPIWGIGVDLFFVISGFVTAASFNAGASRPFAGKAMAFLKRRLIRVGPVLALLIALGALFGASGAGGTSWPEIISGMTFTANVLQVQCDAGAKLCSTPGILSPLWSLATEMQFYCIVPLLALLSRRALLVMVIMSLAVGTLWLRPWGEGAWYWRPEAFLIGTALFRFRARVETFSEHMSVPACVFLFICAAIGGRLMQGHLSGLYVALIAVIAALTVIASLRGNNSEMLQWLGHRSYAIYLLHCPILYAVASLPWYAALIIVIVCVLGLSHVATIFYDEPLRKWLMRK
jgi:peptidoglycan/LPS O-acetylase OafA/YrhL